MKGFIDDIIEENFGNIEFDRSFEFELPRKKEISFNVRIPFCSNQCDYCLYGDSRVNPETLDSFIDSVIKEIDLYMEGLGNPEINTLYFIAGTPTQIPEKLGEIIKYLEEEYGFSGEVLTEAHPNDLDNESLKYLNEIGIDKLKIGVQSFENHVLEHIGRDHDRDIAVEAVEKTLEHDFNHVNIDLMFGLPSQTVDDMVNTLETAIELDIPSVTTFPLMLLPRSQLYSKVSTGEEEIPENETELYKAIRDKLTDNGYEMITIWSFSKQPEEYRGEYMHSNDFIGIGPGNWSYLNNSFYLNTSNLKDYNKATAEGLPISVGTQFDGKDQRKLWFIRNLYFTEITEEKYQETFGKPMEKDIKELIELLHTLELIQPTNNGYKLTEQGLDLASKSTKKIVMTLLNKFQENHLVGATPRPI
ncbi:Coproporphyrinogen III oxidase [Methanonatronarchaeum thermophilum]|uniref:Coproporphyrinogen III oxidase n=1 Tax=Methanonatronarchaeum thermophilum TaxID=1927129 RepID=A0A1Y3GAZ7_9EURY|nr:radical SAM protein [Methanonatronarchaeum thermophilum]OUJ18579.1 Coproporphyrinogen III oxidase [Methanonatronarchaeum thermophilum]